MGGKWCLKLAGTWFGIQLSFSSLPLKLNLAIFRHRRLSLRQAIVLLIFFQILVTKFLWREKREDESIEGKGKLSARRNLKSEACCAKSFTCENPSRPLARANSDEQTFYRSARRFVAREQKGTKTRKSQKLSSYLRNHSLSRSWRRQILTLSGSMCRKSNVLSSHGLLRLATLVHMFIVLIFKMMRLHEPFCTFMQSSRFL